MRGKWETETTEGNGWMGMTTWLGSYSSFGYSPVRISLSVEFGNPSQYSITRSNGRWRSFLGELCERYQIIHPHCRYEM